MSIKDSQFLSEIMKREAVSMDQLLVNAVTQRQLYFHAYTYLQMQVDDLLTGIIDGVTLVRRGQLLREVMSDHLARVQDRHCDGTPPARHADGDELKR